MRGKISILIVGLIFCLLLGYYVSDAAVSKKVQLTEGEADEAVTKTDDYSVNTSNSASEAVDTANATENGEEYISLTYLEAEEPEALSVDTIAVSEAGKTARLCPVEGYKFYSLEVTSEDGSVQVCELTNMLFTALLRFEWIDEERVIIEGHVNPALNVYIIYDLTSNSFCSYDGLYFVWDEAYENMYYVEKAPYWSDEQTVERILDMDGNVYFETEAGQTLVNNLVLDTGNTAIGFFVQDESTSFEVIDMDTAEILYEEQNVSYQNVEIRVR